jgi:hypothetical protein
MFPTVAEAKELRDSLNNLGGDVVKSDSIAMQIEKVYRLYEHIERLEKR